MCGIVGYVGQREVVPLLLNGLRSLEYRGYDSAGVVVLRDGELEAVKAEGKLDRLIEKEDRRRYFEALVRLRSTDRELIVGRIADAVVEGRAMRKDLEEEIPAVTEVAMEGIEEMELTDEELLGEATLAKISASQANAKSDRA